MNSLKWLLTLLFLLSIFTFSCQNDDGVKDDSPEDIRSGTQKMADTLKYFSENIDPLKNYYASEVRAEYLQQKLNASNDPRERGKLMYSLLIELINSNKNDEAIQLIADLVQAANLDINNIDRNSRLIFERLALAHLRKGELENCLANHTAESCLLPLENGGIHTLPNGSRMAIAIYEKMLINFPEDYNSRWLLNLAYMTLGNYPSDVPKQWLIPGMTSNKKSPIEPFLNISMGMGIDVNNIAGGSSVEDFNNDGYLDILVSSYALDHQIQLFINKGDGTFENKTNESGLKGILSGLNMIQADYNNDGFEDVFILRGAWWGTAGEIPNSLLKNNGDGTFEDVTFDAKIASFYPTQAATWNDFNSDGWLDLFVVNESVDEVKGGYPCELYLNQKDGTFEDIAIQAGLTAKGYFKGVTSGDVNNDGLPDIYISNLNGSNYLFLNETETEVVFRDITKSTGVENPQYSFPVWMFDYDNDGWVDIFSSSYDHRHMQEIAQDEAIQMLGIEGDVIYPKLYKNNSSNSSGEVVFLDVTDEVDLDRVMFPMGANFGDLDNDGFLDMYLGTGSPDLKSIVPNLVFYNHKGKRFEDITYSSGMAHIQKGHGVSFADFDHDGDQDIYTVMGGAYSGDNFHNALFENPNDKNAWVTLDLEGVKTNRSAIGTRLKVTAIDKKGVEHNFHRVVSTGGSFGASTLRQEIGLGDAVSIKQVEIIWANAERTKQVFKNVPIKKAFKIIEGKDELIPMNYEAVKMEASSSHAHHH